MFKRHCFVLFNAIVYLYFHDRTELLVRFAKKMQCEKIMLGDNASCLASRLMSCIVQGRGAQIPCEMVILVVKTLPQCCPTFWTQRGL